MRAFLDHETYAVVLAHPDDEMYTANILSSLTDAGKELHLIYLTSGDYFGAEVGRSRERELANAAGLLGVPFDRLHLLRFSERALGQELAAAMTSVAETVQQIKPSCLLTHDYEGGHNGHDYVSYVGSTAARSVGADLWVFPAYHKQPHERLWNQFIDGRDIDFQLDLDDSQRELKYQIFSAHASQREFFDRVLASSSKDPLLGREIIRIVSEDIDYTTKPTDPVGYEFDGSPIKFSDFKDLIAQARLRQQ